MRIATFHDPNLPSEEEEDHDDDGTKQTDGMTMLTSRKERASLPKAARKEKKKPAL